jgi:hypothetical protein
MEWKKAGSVRQLEEMKTRLLSMTLDKTNEIRWLAMVLPAKNEQARKGRSQSIVPNHAQSCSIVPDRGSGAPLGITQIAVEHTVGDNFRMLQKEA